MKTTLQLLSMNKGIDSNDGKYTLALSALNGRSYGRRVVVCVTDKAVESWSAFRAAIFKELGTTSDDCEVLKPCRGKLSILPDSLRSDDPAKLSGEYSSPYAAKAAAAEFSRANGGLSARGQAFLERFLVGDADFSSDRITSLLRLTGLGRAVLSGR
jgi:hypothetical protein